MKIRKPDDEKYFKDIVLNDILVEISNENDADNTTPLQAEKKKFLLTRMTVLLLSILTLVIVVIFWERPSEPTIKIEETKPINIKQTNTIQSWKMNKDQEGYAEPKGAEKIDVSKSKILYNEPKNTQLKPIPIQKTQRELAKEALKQQMLN